ncbi:hypothetical protein [Actinophytocola sp.]|uniref:hypothetical protein n=1 Tax=Actinophytocola sp. TaxID=1872138 RepID=UPI002D81053D|nr:hypothetical protein [Actinophytocola sp.]HET9138587.1 hypothetical protein [Actinophytocola sp.]
MTHEDDLPERVTRLERQMKRCRVDSTAARVLASAADRDVAEFRTTYHCPTKVLNALRETQLAHDEKLKQHDTRFDRLETKFDELEAKMTDGFSTVAVGQAQITALLTIAIGKSEGEAD